MKNCFAYLPVCLLLLIAAFNSNAQTTVYCSATGSAGSYKTGYINLDVNTFTYTRHDGSMLVSSTNVGTVPAANCGYAVFDPSGLGIPSTATITSASLTMNYTYSGVGTWYYTEIHAVDSDLSTETDPHVLYNDINYYGATLYNFVQYTSSPYTLSSTGPGFVDYLQNYLNQKITLGFLTEAGYPTTSVCTYTFTGETGTAGSSTATAPTLTITYTCNPTIKVTSNVGDTICTGNSVTFLSTITNGGASQSYQWQQNGVNISGATNASYTASSINSGDVFSCVLTGNAMACSTDTVANSNNVTMTVVSSASPSIHVTAGGGDTVCSGIPITFTCATTYGGVPSYQWMKNGAAISGATDAAYTTSTISSNDIFSCFFTSGLSCASPDTVTSNSDTMTVIPSVTASISIADSEGTAICVGQNVTFTTSITNGGTSPSYQWEQNALMSLSGAYPTYTVSTVNNNLFNNDTIRCILTSSLACAAPVTGNYIVITIDSNVAPGVTITKNTGDTITQGTNVTFTANVTNGGSAPTYQWITDLPPYSVAIPGATGSTYTTDSLYFGQFIGVIVYSNAHCASPDSAISNYIRMVVYPLGVEQVGNNASILLYPNPTNGTFTIHAPGDGILHLISVLGQELCQFNVSQNNSVIHLPETLSKGVYYGKFEGSQGNVFGMVRIIYE